MSPVETISAPIALPAPTLTRTDGGGTNALHMNRAGTVIYGGRGPAGGTTVTLRRSFDDGATWETVKDFGFGVLGLCETGDGEVLVALALTSGVLMKSTGWSINPLTATWRQVLAPSGTNCYFRTEWGGHLNSVRGSTIIVNEYGPQTASGFANPAATKIWKSTDNGDTFTLIYDLLTAQPGAYPLHMHATSHDPWTPGRIWQCNGDGGTASTPNARSGIRYSDDGGSTWTLVPGTDNNSATNQVTTIVPMRDCILFLPDGPPFGILRLARTGPTTFGALQVAHLVRGGTNGIALGYQAWRNRDDPTAPLLMAITTGSTAQTIAGNGMLLVTWDGFTFYELTRDSAILTASKGYHNVVGPTATGKVIATLGDGRQTNPSRVVFTMPSRESMPAAL